jgi:hypothetical protein
MAHDDLGSSHHGLTIVIEPVIIVILIVVDDRTIFLA